MFARGEGLFAIALPLITRLRDTLRQRIALGGQYGHFKICYTDSGKLNI